MLYTINPTLQIESISFEENCIIYNHYHQVKTEVNIAQLALLCDVNWPISHKQLLEVAQDFIDKNEENDIFDSINYLIDLKLIVLDTEPYVQTANYWIENGWSAALFYHLSSQRIEHWDDVYHQSNQIDKLKKEFEDRYTNDQINWFRNELIYTRKSNKIFNLNKQLLENNKSFDEVVKKRSSFKEFTPKSINLNEISHILWASNKLNHQNRIKCYSSLIENPELVRSSLYTPLELYVYIRKADDTLENGLYHFNCHNFTLDKLDTPKDFDDRLIESCAGQERASGGSASILITAHFDRIMERYQHARAYRTLMVNIGEMAQNIIMNTTYLDKSYFISPAILDEEGSKLLNLEKSARSLYLISIG